MDPEIVKKQLAQVLAFIQSMSGLECPTITDSTKPADDLKKFNSKMWPVGAGMLASALGITIPARVCIFRLKGTKTALTVAEIAALVCRLAAVHAAPTATAAE